jgi:putative redox protein
MGTSDDKPAISPMELLLLGLAGCTGMDIVSILQKKRVRLSAFKIKVIGRRAGTYPMIWTEILVDYLLWGEEIKPKDVEQAIRLSEKKYCSVSIMLGKSAKITSEHHILKPGESAG